MFIARESEMGKLNKFHESNRFEMLVMYGRRRVGKTKLLMEFLKGKNGFYFVAEENNTYGNMVKMTNALKDFFGIDYNLEFRLWEDLFKFVSSQVGDERLVIVIDELPYIVQSDSNFLSTLQNIIDHELTEKNVMLILCGSAISFMEDELIAHKSPLFGRKTGQMKIEPFDYYDSAQFLKNYSYDDLVSCYGILGGIPHYLKRFNSNVSVKDNVLNEILDTSAYLFDEPTNLMHQELRNPAVYNAIIGAIAGGASKLNEIATKIQEDVTKTSKYLNSLLELQVVTRVNPISAQRSKKSIYVLNDNLFRFIYRFVYANKSMVEQELGEWVYDEKVESELKTYLGKTFESICKEYLIRMNKNLALPFVIEQIGTWWGGNPKTKQQEEIDIVGLSELKGLYCECKYRNDLVGVEVLEKLKERSDLLPRDERYYFIFSKSGFTEALQNISKKDDKIKLVDLSMIYELR